MACLGVHFYPATAEIESAGHRSVADNVAIDLVVNELAVALSRH